MFGNILQRMIYRELAKVFTLSLLGITGILLMAGIVAEASQFGLSPAQVLSIIPLLIPSTLPYTIPATTLFATCVVYGRLSADNEILAIRAAGINLRMVLWPGLILGVLMSAATMGLYYRIIPYTHSLMRSMFLSDVEEMLYAMLRKDHAINQPRLNYAMWVRQVQGRKLLHALFKRRDEKGNYDVIAFAREAELRVDMKRRQLLLQLRNGQVFADGGGANGYFQDRWWELPLPPALGSDHIKRPRDMSWKELFVNRRGVVTEISQTEREMEKTAVRLKKPPVPPDLPQHMANLKDKRKHLLLEQYSIDSEFYMRPALSLGCICFILVGCPVGIWFSRSDYLSSFITCFLPIVFLYYPLMLCGTNLAKDGKLHPAMPIFAADVVLAVIGVWLFRRLTAR